MPGGAAGGDEFDDGGEGTNEVYGDSSQNEVNIDSQISLNMSLLDTEKEKLFESELNSEYNYDHEVFDYSN